MRLCGSGGKTRYGEGMTLSSDPSKTAPEYAVAFELTPASGLAARVVFASPHSGRERPEDMGAAPGLTEAVLRSAEDVGVDRLVASGPAAGAPLIAGRVSRAYVDLNRAPDELDPQLIEGFDCPDPSAKVSAGFGVIPRRAGNGAALYERRLSMAEARGRLERTHTPYHAALGTLMHAARDHHGMALLIDWHSMPSRATAPSPASRVRGPEIILGDRHGSACRGATTRRVRALFEAQGWRVGMNAPYAGGYSTQTWGRPDEGFQAIQVEVSRALYLNEETLEPSTDHDRFVRALERVIVALAREPWSR